MKLLLPILVLMCVADVTPAFLRRHDVARRAATFCHAEAVCRTCCEREEGDMDVDKEDCVASCRLPSNCK